SAAAALHECTDRHSMRHAKTILEEIKGRSDSEFRITCFKTLSKIGHTSLIKPMIALSTILRPNEARFLEKLIFDLGLKTVPAVVSILVDTDLPDRSRIVAGKTLAQLSLPQLNAHLPDVIRKEIERAYFYFYYAVELPAEYQGHDLFLLKEGLLSSFQSVIDFIIQLLGASKWIEDCELILFSLRSKNQKIISQAIETLEMCCERTIFQLLYPLIGGIPLEEKLNRCLQYTDTTLTVEEVLEKMANSANTLDLILATTWKYRLDLPNWRTMLRKQMASREEVFHHFAYELLET
ncbi:MAG: putative lipoprotein, partial [Chlamydiia bacterium]|nr:putative lipoprotein [Chlamydiia bacterium]